MRKVFTSENKVKIYLLKSQLEQSGIQCFIKNENPPLAGEIPPVMAWPELWIMNDEKNFHEAERIIQSEIESESRVKSKWTCPRCGELLEGQFEICWKCGSGVEVYNILTKILEPHFLYEKKIKGLSSHP